MMAKEVLLSIVMSMDHFLVKRKLSVCHFDILCGSNFQLPYWLLVQYFLLLQVLVLFMMKRFADNIDVMGQLPGDEEKNI